MNENNKFIGESRITPYLTVRDAKKAISFYKKAFGFALAGNEEHCPDMLYEWES